MALIAAMINRYGVNVPYADEWSVLTLLGKWEAHQLTLADFFSVHNGHRILVPRVIYLALTKLAHESWRAEMFCSLFLCSLGSGAIYLLLRRTVSGSTRKHLALWALINLFLFSPIQAENWLWGFQLQVFLSNLCVVGAIVCITSGMSLPLRFASTVVFALAGTFSFGNGVLIWPTVFLILVCRREKLGIGVSWIVIAALGVIAFSVGYPAREPTPPTTRWFDYLLYFAAFLGAPLARIPNSHPLVLPVILGSVLVAGYLWMAATLVRRHDALRKSSPWLALGAYAIASAAMAARARIHTGAGHALDSRYTTVALLLLVSLIGVVGSMNAIGQKGESAKLSWRNVIVGIAIASLLALYAVNVPFELRYLRLSHGFRALGKGALEFSRVLDLERTYRDALLVKDDPETLVRRLGVLDRLKLLDPPRRLTAVLDDGEGRWERTTDELGTFERVEFESADSLVASGWSYLPGEARPPAAVLLAYGSGHDWKAFALSAVRERRTDLTTRFVDRSYLETGWRLSFARSVLPPGAPEISAWALEAKQGRTYRLPGSFKLPR